MRKTTSIELTRRALDLVKHGDTTRSDDIYMSPVESYICPDWLAQERAILFKEYPLLVAFSCDLPNAGDFITNDDVGVPLLVIRDKKGQINAFFNTCQHRGAKLVTGCGRAQGGLICPYHAWNYEFNGELKVIPDEVSFPGVNKTERSLKSLPVVEKYGMIWVCPTPGKTFDIDAQLGGLGKGMVDDLKAYEFQNYHPYAQRRMHRKMNWKLLLDTFLEPYHFAPLHPTTVGPLVHHNMCLLDTYGQNLREAVIRKSIDKLADEPEDSWDFPLHSALVYMLFPNAGLIMQRDHVELWRSYPVADKPDECIVQMDYYIPEPAETQSAKDHWERNMDLAVSTVIEEDIPGVEGIQVGLSSEAISHSTFGRCEPALIHFQREVAKSIGRA
ncbi:MAG: aromatic ring-hydroxylating dioxygenase subunit alpha [Porticoccaceae bacterium]|nr:aromatic ring-hydroxylating dioxygenase subunit alpha [Porticoccaceae bacterium]